jgi:N-methylhydantoinase B/oxoprolinase/acetone carboxylase alpha subunit
MLALDEYGTRRIKQWMKHSIEPALRQMGKVIMQISQSVYTANKRFRIIQPSALQENREVEINVPVYNNMGEAIGKSMDYSAAKFDVRIVAGSTLPVNRWAYLAELKELLQFGVIDDIAVLAETDVRNKEQIAKRKSLYSQLQGQLSSLQQAMKDKEGTIETLERQLVQAGIKSKVMQAEMEITKKKEEVKGDLKDSFRSTTAKQKLLQNVMSNEVDSKRKDLAREVEFAKKDLQSSNENK